MARKPKTATVETPGLEGKEAACVFDVRVRCHREALPVEDTVVRVEAEDARQAIDLARRKAHEDTTVTDVSIHGLDQVFA